MNANERIGAATRSVEQQRTSREASKALRRLPEHTPGAPIVPPDLRAAELLGALRRRIAARPMTATLIGLSAGFVLGGALSFRAGRMALGVAGRHFLRELLKEVL
jgi:hypothetical protein